MKLRVAFSLNGSFAEGLDRATFELTDQLASVSFRKLSEGELVKHEKAGDVLVTSIGEFEPPRKVTEWLKTSGTDVMPADLATRTHERSRQLLEAARSVVRVTQWVAARMEGVKPTKSFRSDEFQIGDGPWRRIETKFDLKLSWGHPTRTINGPLLEEVRQILRTGGEEPLSNVLLREAWSLVETSPRSALVLGIASMESCVKRLIILCIPDSQWLVENVPSPPIESMLKNFVGELKTKVKINGKVVPPPQTLLNTIKNAVGLRNRVVHGISQEVSAEKVKEYLGAIADINVLMDVYGGNDWAIKNMSVDTSKALTQSLGVAPK